MPPLKSENQSESEHPLNPGLHLRVQSFFTAGQADFATGFPPSGGLKLIELGHRTSILRARALQISREPDRGDWKPVSGGTPLIMLVAVRLSQARAAVL